MPSIVRGCTALIVFYTETADGCRPIVLRRSFSRKTHRESIAPYRCWVLISDKWRSDLRSLPSRRWTSTLPVSSSALEFLTIPIMSRHYSQHSSHAWPNRGYAAQHNALGLVVRSVIIIISSSLLERNAVLTGGSHLAFTAECSVPFSWRAANNTVLGTSSSVTPSCISSSRSARRARRRDSKSRQIALQTRT